MFIIANRTHIHVLAPAGEPIRQLRSKYRAYPRRIAREYGAKVIYRVKPIYTEYVRSEIDDIWDAFWGPTRVAK